MEVSGNRKLGKLNLRWSDVIQRHGGDRSIERRIWKMKIRSQIGKRPRKSLPALHKDHPDTEMLRDNKILDRVDKIEWIHNRNSRASYLSSMFVQVQVSFLRPLLPEVRISDIDVGAVV